MREIFLDPVNRANSWNADSVAFAMDAEVIPSAGFSSSSRRNGCATKP
ncbi:MAG: hypothetical protein SOV58_06320 [Candidatus Enteromonas sp.]|nr:hypothetical protein [Candidatus Enteromonas sp.]